MTSNPATLARLARCYCLNGQQVRAAMIYLLAQILQKKSVSPIAWTPDSAVATWTDSAGAHTGNLAAFLATTTWPSTTSLSLANKGVTSITNFSSLTALASLNLSLCPITSLDLTGLTSLSTLLNLNDCSSLSSLTSSTLQTLGATTITQAPLSTLSFPSLTTLTGAFTWGGNGTIPPLTSFSLPSLTTCTGVVTSSNNITIGFTTANNTLVSISLPSLASTSGRLSIHDCSALTSVSVPSYTSCDGVFIIYNCPLVTSLTIPCTSQGGGGSVSAYNMAGLTSLSFPNLVSTQGWNMANNPALTQFSAPLWDGVVGGSYTYTWNGGALASTGSGGQFGVNDILILINTKNAWPSGVTINLAGGTNGAPSGIGITAKAQLITKGATMTTN